MVAVTIQDNSALATRLGVEAHTRQYERRALRGFVLTAAVVLATLCGTAHADEIKLGGFWIKDVNIHSVQDGQVLYFNRVGTEFTRPLEGVQGLHLSAYPQLAQAQQAIADGDDRTAAALLQEVWGKARTDWLRQWVSHLLIGVYDRMGLPYEAVDTYLMLVRENAPGFYLDHPPIDSLAAANDEVKQQLRERIESILDDVTDAAAARGIQELLSLLKVESASAQDEPAIQLAGDGDNSPSPAASAQDSEKTTQDPDPQRTSGPMLAQATQVDDTVTQMLMYSRYAQAVARTDKILENSGQQMPMRLYQRGMALKGLAEESGDLERYLDAGLSFMSVVAYFPGSGFAGPSLVEAGMVHSKIGRSDIAKQLFKKAELAVDAEDEPRYAARIEQLLAETAD